MLYEQKRDAQRATEAAKKALKSKHRKKQEELDNIEKERQKIAHKVKTEEEEEGTKLIGADGREVSERQAGYGGEKEAGNVDTMIDKAMDDSAPPPDEGVKLSEGAEFVEYALCIFGVNSKFRETCLRISDSKPMEFFIFVCVAISSIAIAMDSPWQPDDQTQMILAILDPVLLGIFTLEMLLRCAAYGFYGTRTAYIADPYNRLDFFVICISYLTILLSFLPGGIGRVLRVLRSLLPT